MPRIRQLILPAFLCLTGIGMFMPLHFDVNTDLCERSMDALHLPVFAIFTWVLAFANPLGFVRRKPAGFLAAAAAIVAAGAVELLQARFGREASFVDFFNGLLGVVIAITVLARRKALILATAIVGIWIAAAPAAREAMAVAWRAENFPLLGDFESGDELLLWLARDHDHLTSMASRTRVAAHATSGDYALRVQITKSAWTGLRLLCADQNWNDYQRLAFDVYCDGAPFTLSIRVDDADSKVKENRCNVAVQINPGENEISIPLKTMAEQPKQNLDLSRIRRVVLFVNQPQQPYDFYLDRVRLE